MAAHRLTANSLFSSQWHHVRDVHAQLAEDVVVTRHVYRKRVSWVLHRRATSTSYRLDTASFELIDRLDGTLSVGELWEQALDQRDRAAPGQDAWMQLLADLHEAELLVVDRQVPVEQLFERRQQQRARDRRQRYLNPLFMRFSLHDPDAWLDRLLPLARVLFSGTALVSWSLLMIVSTAVLVANSERLVDDTANAALLTPHMALLFLLLYPVLKLLHELGHALAIKRCGGDVHETGIALMVMLPLPYVDASASSVFKSKRDRMLVSAAGILVELGVAAGGVWLWAGSHGLMGDIGLVLLLTGGLSTLLINGNPLLKFDGYYLLADWLELPNLQSRARRAVLRTLVRCLTGKPDPAPRIEDGREWRWLLIYGVSSAIYRTALMLSIAWMLSERWYFLGIGLALYAIVTSVLLPLWRAVCALLWQAELRAGRARALALGVPTLVIALIWVVPLPHASVTQGVVWLPDSAVVRATGHCQVSKVLAAPGSDVHRGDSLFHCVDPELEVRELALQARMDELDASLAGLARTDPVESAQLEPERLATRKALDDTRERLAMEHHRAGVDGRFDVSQTSALLGRAFQRGEITGYVVPDVGRTIRLAIAENAIAAVDEQVKRVEVRIKGADQSATIYRTAIRHRAPRATLEVPSAALSTEGGGSHAADAAGDGRQLQQAVYDIELEWPPAASPAPVGAHVGVRFVHPPAPLGERLVDTIYRAFVDRTPT